MKFILPINVKMPTVVGILTFISRVNILSVSFNASLYFQYFSFYEQLKFRAQSCLLLKSLITLLTDIHSLDCMYHEIFKG